MATLLNTFLALVTQVANIVIQQQCPLTWDYLYPQFKNIEFDFVIVGAGTAGCTLANRLTENPNWNVLLIESGDYPSNISEVPAMFVTLQKTKEDWSFKTEPSSYFQGYNNSVSTWPQGRAVGGSSTINAMLYAPGIPYDYDYWSKLGNDGWDWANVKQYFRKLNADLSDEGYVKTMRYRSIMPTRTLLVAAALELGVPVNSGGVFGYRDVPVTINKNQRFSMAKAYLNPIKNRPNLSLMTNTLVTKIIIKNKKAIGVEIELPNGDSISINAKKEVIVSAGAINSPKLLMLSGIGPATDLQKLGIPVYRDAPVGKNLQDHLVVPIMIELLGLPLEISIQTLLTIYCATRQGLLNQVDIANFQGYINTRNETTRPNIEFIHFTLLKNDPVIFGGFVDKFGFNYYYRARLKEVNARTPCILVLPTLLHPQSRGHMVLANTDPHSPPKITANYFDDPDDLEIILEAIAFVQRMKSTLLMSLLPFADLQLTHCNQFKFNTREYWKCYALTFVTTIYHPCGTCIMGNDSTASVVSPKLKVWGIDKLRVIDSSVIPELPSGHTNIPTCMIAEKGADIIKADYN